MIQESAHILGIDPGATGGLAILDAYGKPVSMCPMPMQAKEFDVDAIFQVIQGLPAGSRVVMERVHAFPGQSVVAMFSFGLGYGLIQGLVRASQVPLELVSPVTWQKAAAGRTGGDKNVTRAWCLRTFPGSDFPMTNRRPKGGTPYKEIHEGVSDALGIAWFGFMKYGRH